MKHSKQAYTGHQCTHIHIGKLTKDNGPFLSLKLGGNWWTGSVAWRALIHNDKVVLASFRRRRKLHISDFNTSTSALSRMFSWIACSALRRSCSCFNRLDSRDRLAATLFLRLRSQYRPSFLSSGTGCRRLFVRLGSSAFCCAELP